MKGEHLQDSFAAGEIGPAFYGRHRSPIYQAGLARVENWEVLPQGPLLRRGGSRHVWPLEGDGPHRIIEFRSAAGDAYVIEIASDSVRVYNSAGRVQPPAVNLVGPVWINGSFGGTPLSTFAGSGGTVKVIRYFDSESKEWETVEGVARQDLAIDPGLHAYRIKFKVSSLSGVSAGVSVSLGDSPAFTAHATGTYELRRENFTGNTLAFEAVGAGPNTIAVTEVEVYEEVAEAVVMASPWTAEQVRDIQYVVESANDRIIFAHPNVAPQVLTLAGGSAWALAPAVFTSAPAQWTGTNWPGAIELFQGRLWLGGTPAQRSTVWASRSGSIFDFTTHEIISGTDTTLDSHAIVAPLATRGAIRWLRGRFFLLVGTDLGELSITAAGDVITPTNLQVRTESAYGSAAVQAADVGDQVLYVSSDRRKLRVIDYSLDRQAWVSQDITFAAPHITAGAIREVHYARNPNTTVVLVLDSGEVACCTYDRGAQVAAWWRITTDGTVISAAVAQEPAGSVLYLAVERANGAALEAIPLGEVEERVHCDAAVTVAVPEDLVVPGLDHLEGQSVQIVLDGALEPAQTVVDGAVTLERAGAVVTVGLPFTARARLLRPLSPSATPRQKGRWVQLFLRLYASALPEVNGERPADRSPATPLDQAEPLWTTDVGPFDTGQNDEDPTEVVIEQVLPFRTEILSLFGTVSVNEV